MYNRFDTMLKEVDEEYRATLINFAKYNGKINKAML